VPQFTPLGDIRPSLPVAGVGLKPGGAARVSALMRWYLMPHWPKAADGPKPIDARADAVHAKPAFREPFRKRRCRIPALGFDE
jgi:putative SOS response-associated peptidase YedK